MLRRSVVTPTDAQWEALADYVDKVRAQMNLGQWNLKLAHDPPPESDDPATDVTAEIKPIAGRYMATIRVAIGFWEEKPEDQRTVIVHELAHLYHQPATEPIRAGGILKQLGQATYDVLWAEVQRGAELLTDHVTTVMADWMPLPDLAKPQKPPKSE
jgi:hypothetical protein